MKKENKKGKKKQEQESVLADLKQRNKPNQTNQEKLSKD